MDYKELIDRLSAYSAEYQCHGGITAEAADALEALLAERDAAVAELNRIAEFTETEFLGYLNETIHQECGYSYYTDLFDLLCRVTHWEYDDKWRGKEK